MTHTYQITGMTCSGCEAKVKSSLLSMEDVTSAEVSKDQGTASVTMTKHIPLESLQLALGGGKSKYHIAPLHHSEAAEQTKSWLATYKPILLIFFYLSIISILGSVIEGDFIVMHFMTLFMAGFFLVFSFFKMLDLRGFAESYAMYDLVAMKFKGWGYIYAFCELSLGIAYILYPNSIWVNGFTLLLMSISISGVLRSVLKRQKIQCACLGAIFNLPMSTITIIEDALMIVMSGIMLVYSL